MNRTVPGRTGGVVVLVVPLLLSALRAGAQTNDELYANIQLDFAAPGGRSLSMGQAFIGEANDASAAYTNPAGLISLPQLEAFFEVRLQDVETTVADGSSFTGTPTNQGIDQGGAPKSFAATASGLTFLSVVYPFERSVVAFYRHQLTNFRSTVDGSQGAFLRDGEARTRTGALENDLSLDITGIGFSGAYRLNDRIWLGAGISTYSMDLEAVSGRHATTDVDPQGNPITFFDAVDIEPSTQTDRRVENAEDSDIGFNLGLIFRNDSNTISFGAVYRRGPKFNYRSEYRLGPKSIADGTDPSVETVLSGEATLHVPDVLGAGVSFRPRPGFTFNIDYARVLYSNLEPDANFDLTVASGAASLDDFRVEDGNELHLGAEYVLTVTESARVAIRGGLWHDPDHRLAFVGAADTLQARFPSGEDKWHVAGGIGVLVSSFDLNFGFDTSAFVSRATFASTVRF